MSKAEKIFSLHLNSNKPDSFEKFSLSFIKNISNPSSLEIIVHIDKGDNLMKEKINRINKKYNSPIKYIETSLIKNFNDAWKPINILLEKTSESVKIIACLSDDITVETKNWDLYYLKYLKKYHKDEIFRIRCSKYKHETYKNHWECAYKPDFSFYSKKWVDIVGFWNPCIGPDTFQESVSYYLNMYGENYKRSEIDLNVIYKGEETLTGLSLSSRIKRAKLGYISFNKLISYKIQKLSSISAYNLAKEINCADLKIIKINFLKHSSTNFFKKLMFFHFRGNKSWFTSNIIFNIMFIMWCKVDIFDKFIEYIICYLEKKNLLNKLITNESQYKKLIKAIKNNV